MRNEHGSDARKKTETGASRPAGNHHWNGRDPEAFRGRIRARSPGALSESASASVGAGTGARTTQSSNHDTEHASPRPYISRAAFVADGIGLERSIFEQSRRQPVDAQALRSNAETDSCATAEAHSFNKTGADRKVGG